MSGKDAGVVLELDGISKRYPASRGLFRSAGAAEISIVEDVSFTIRRGETFGLLGESGSGKSTLARIALRLLDPSAGRVRLVGEDITSLTGAALRRQRRRMQLVPQNARGALDARFTIGRLLEEPLVIHAIGDAASRRAAIAEILAAVGLTSDVLARRPAQLSGGQNQRIALARALLLKPDLVVLDEPVSALDVSVQAQTLNLLKDLQRRFGLTYLFIGHDPIVARYFCDRIGRLEKGRLVAAAPA